MISHDVVIIGSGLAGMTAAIEAARQGADVAIVTKTYPTRAHSVEYQGGTAASLGRADPDDNWETHMYDTVKGSDFLADQDAVEIMVKEAPEAIMELEHMGAVFSRREDGRINQRMFGGHSKRRACFASDKTGTTVLHTLFERLIKCDVEVYYEWFVTDLMLEDGICKGIVAYDMRGGELRGIKAKSTILCTGGYGRVYSITSNDLRNNADGHAIAFRNGVPLEDMEFQQFHPTGIYGYGILMTEGIRGEGGYLINDRGERFLREYPETVERMELSPRDAVARAIQSEIDKGRGICGKDYVYLDARHLGSEKIKERLPLIRELSMDIVGVDPIEEPIPIQPTAHYAMGGIYADINCSTPVGALYAAGECACVSVHGANRLGTNSSIECVVFGKRAGKFAAENAKKTDEPEINEAHLESENERFEDLVGREGDENVYDLKEELQDTMMNHMHIFRDESGMKEGLRKIKEIRGKFDDIYIEDKGKTFNTAVTEAIEFDTLSQIAEVMTKCALAREESRGSHYRTDFPERNDENWLKHSIAYLRNGKIELEYEPVRITRFEPE